MRIILAAGGTAGHINPALAAAGELKHRHPDADILFIGAKNRMEATLVPNAGFKLETVTISGFYRKISIKNLFRNVQTVYHISKPTQKINMIVEKIIFIIVLKVRIIYVG
jgi:UDP-N-acetylglucosamine--N-acetylmuramyl-(pentapeptide) pyrophosphoryl-undecaprenol N-acetylglucosamine transferase